MEKDNMNLYMCRKGLSWYSWIWTAQLTGRDLKSFPTLSYQNEDTEERQLLPLCWWIWGIPWMGTIVWVKLVSTCKGDKPILETMHRWRGTVLFFLYFILLKLTVITNYKKDSSTSTYQCHCLLPLVTKVYFSVGNNCFSFWWVFPKLKGLKKKTKTNTVRDNLQIHPAELPGTEFEQNKLKKYTSPFPPPAPNFNMEISTGPDYNILLWATVMVEEAFFNLKIPFHWFITSPKLFPNFLKAPG